MFPVFSWDECEAANYLVLSVHTVPNSRVDIVAAVVKGDTDLKLPVRVNIPKTEHFILVLSYL